VTNRSTLRVFAVWVLDVDAGRSSGAATTIIEAQTFTLDRVTHNLPIEPITREPTGLSAFNIETEGSHGDIIIWRVGQSSCVSVAVLFAEALDVPG
jgi:hypothetical protein